LDVVILDRKRFPRDKVCAGWITPQILQELEVEPEHYRKERVMQPIRGFRISRVGDAAVDVEYDEVVSYGIRRCELDQYLLERCGARLQLGEPIRELRRSSGRWVVNESTSASVLVGAGGHFCPVARHLGAEPGAHEPTVVAREVEFEMTPVQQRSCPVRAEIPELFFAADLRGYGWVVRKGDWLNVGLGRQDTHAFPRRVDEFLAFLEDHGRIPADLPRGLRGHAYLLYEQAPRPLVGDAALLIGDAAGLAYGRSGEGIRPAVESGLLAARAILAAGGQLGADSARGYERALLGRFGRRYGRIRPGPSDWIPQRWRGRVAGRLLSTAWFARHVVIDRWFLHRRTPPLASSA
jgi:flavin-dependent dehydrogenase